MVVNTSKSIFKRPDEIPPQAEAQMPEQPEPDDIGPDEVEEDERDREGNDDPGTNCPPIEEPEAARIRRAALDNAAAQINAAAMAQAMVDTAPRVAPAKPVIIQSFKYLTIGNDKGMFHITGTDSIGEPFTLTEAAPPNLTAMGIVEYLEGIAATK